MGKKEARARIKINKLLEGAGWRFMREYQVREVKLLQKFISIYHPEVKFVQVIGQFMKAYILDNKIQSIMESKEYSELATNPGFNMRDLKELNGWIDPVIEYIKDYVSLNSFT